MSSDDKRARLIEAICASQLPGDDTIGGDALKEIAQFLLKAAQKREPGKPAILIDTQAGERRFMRLAIVNDDMPFLVDSLAAVLSSQGILVDRLLHPIVDAKRTKAGTLQALAADCDFDDETCGAESLIYIESARVDARARREVESELQRALEDVRAAVGDWQKMQDAMREDALRLEDPEGEALLGWLAEGMLTQLGHVTRKRDGSETARLGICKRKANWLLADGSWDRAFEWFDKQKGKALARAPLVIKANRISRVHRRVPLDLFIVPHMEDGKAAALSVHTGIWTSAALNTPPDLVPRLRRQFAKITKTLGFAAGSHTGKALLHALTVLPHDLLIGLDDKDVARLATRMSGLTDRPRPRLELIEAPLGRHLFAFVWLPRDLVSTQVRERILGWLEEETGGSTLDWSLHIEHGELAMLRSVLDIRDVDKIPDAGKLDPDLQAMLRGWGEAIERALAEVDDGGRSLAVAHRYASAFPVSYRLSHGAQEASQDIVRLRKLEAQGETGEEPDCDAPRRDARLTACAEGESDRLALKIYQIPGQMPLSDAVPTLENFGFRVLAEVPTPLENGVEGTIHEFTLGLDRNETAQSLLERSDEIETALAEVLNARAEDDHFNRLVTSVGLDVQELDWLRAMYRYMRQTGLSYTIYTVVGALASTPQTTRGLIALFRARLDPQGKDGEKRAEEARKEIREGLAQVHALNDDRLLRQFNALIEAILRTNAFAPAGEEALAFKIDSGEVPGLPAPVPWREIFVYSQRVEGIHLRAGPVARGGLRWSDRRDDFRAEILGLMKAQRVKNAVIVPTGAKGGFYPKALPDPSQDRDAWAAEGKASYQVFIRSLLSITDNIVDGKVVHPEDVLTPDGDDPYFVVAADKGTASFSDVANAIAEERGFWLGDAFASGGSNGYDHKAMGITARGAWVSVQRHFREMGVDVQEEAFDVAGCGDMSGDVFGNGMLLSKTIRLKAAFDHRHIFLDPDPSTERSWEERKRLFEMPRSTWDDYDKRLLSKGGGVFSRTDKRISLSKQVREMLGVEAEEMEPDALISAILKAPVDLLWFGGIGTYIKASSENHLDVEDPANDLLRVNGEDVRAKVIGEGANLGITQAGRIEFALEGGRINTDFIDNSAGVDCSDNEVNIKIALNAARKAGKLSEKRRNAVLEEMTDEVAAIVLEDNRLQTLALSIAERGGTNAAASQIRLIQTLEDSGDLARDTEGLDSEEGFKRRAIGGQGLTRPELAVLLSSTKLALQDAIECSKVPDDGCLEETLIEAFPETMQGKFAAQIKDHQLRREIIATKLANRIINRLGMVHPYELAEEAGANLAQIARAFVVADRLFDLGALWDRLDGSDMPENARLELFDQLAGAVRNHMADLLRVGAGRMGPSELTATLAPHVEKLLGQSGELLRTETRRQIEAMTDRLVDMGAPRACAEEVVAIFASDGATGIAKLAADSEIDVIEVTQAFTELGEDLGLDWAQGTAARMVPSDPWERLLVAGLARDLQQVRLAFLRRLARREKARNDLSGAIHGWMDDHQSEVDAFRRVINRARASAEVTPAMLAQISSQARGLFAP